MPTIDVSDVLLSPEFCESFTVNRRAETVGTDGRNTFTETQLSAYGIFLPASPNDLMRLPEGEMGQQAMTIYSTFQLKGASVGYQPDQVVWMGDNYVVRSVQPFPNYGPGWWVAVIVNTDLVDTSG